MKKFFYYLEVKFLNNVLLIKLKSLLNSIYFIKNNRQNSKDTHHSSQGIALPLVVAGLAFGLTAIWSLTNLDQHLVTATVRTIINAILTAISSILYVITYIFYNFLSFVNNSILAPIIDYIHSLDPFHTSQYSFESPAETLWTVLKGFAYILFVFSSLAAGFQWLFGEDREAQKLIFNIIIVALLINFTYFFIKEAFQTIHTIELGLTGNIYLLQKSNNSELQKTGVGTLLAFSLWQKDPFNYLLHLKAMFDQTYETQVKSLGERGPKQEEDKNALEQITKSAVTIIFLIFIIGSQMLMFIVLIVALVLILARYIMIIFLTAVSPVALASLAFPKFHQGALAKFTSKIVFFDSWFEKLISWLIVVLIFVVLVLIGNTLKNNVLSQIKAIDSFFEFAIMLVILSAWYIMAIIVARNLSGKIGEFAWITAISSLGGIGALALSVVSGGAGGVGNRMRPLTAGLMKSIGTKLTRSRLFPLAKFGLGLVQRGNQMSEESYQDLSSLEQFRLQTLLENFRKEQDEGKRTEIFSQIKNMLQKYNSNPIVRMKLYQTLSSATSQSLNEIFKQDEKEIINLLDIAGKTDEGEEFVVNSMRRLNKKVLENLASDTIINKINSLSEELQNEIANIFIEKLNDSNIFKKLSEGKLAKETINDTTAMGRALRKITNNFISNLMSGNIDKIGTSLNNLSQDAIENFDDIEKIATQLGRITELERGLVKATEQDIKGINMLAKIAAEGRGSTAAKRLTAALEKEPIPEEKLTVEQRRRLDQIRETYVQLSLPLESPENNPQTENNPKEENNNQKEDDQLTLPFENNN